ncbi:type VI secretion protein IcmF/TssM N-terminal domain-containing protein [Aquella oligotrophica]|uniref:Type VI secretion system component TssM1 N-terminal domain-containing protein n=1 Tax=Aquella oligotrophica TaxID=2067065 RepID=A0A2I7N3C7_9NEIS|nr:type VI secretion protein IcmF/TssM N-terminal domain-containing protein [Aquella oligotrophica]AUR50961.1 hypothetical protein CUN60_01120 [Aquella oligotrophica]
MKKFLKIFFSILLLLIIIGAIAWFVLQEGWQWWVGLTIFFGVVGVWLGIIFFRKFLAKRKMQEFVSRIVEQDIPSIDLPGSRANSIQMLRNRWLEATNLIRLSKAQDIPWFVMLGGTESGKTTAIKHAKLSTALSTTVKNLGINKTENCEWWFLEKSIILDTSSKYVIPENELDDTEEWKEFLHLFLKYRKRKPINGVVVTISAERLLTADHMSLRDEGQNLRKRIDNLMRISWAKFPVYVMITKMDYVFGFNEVAQTLDGNKINEAAGFLNNANETWQKMVDDFFDSVFAKFSQLRNNAVNNSDETPSSGMLILPQEFIEIRAAFNEFIQPVFESNSYQEQPICRGIYLSSSKQEASAKSSILKYQGEYVSSQESDSGRQGVFLRDFFDKILPADSEMVVPAYNALRWRYLASSLGILSILSVTVALGSLLTGTYLHNRNVMNIFFNEYKTAPYLGNDVATNIVTLDNFQRTIRKIDSADKQWFLPSFGLTASSNLIDKLKLQYVDMYKKGFLIDFDKQLYQNIVKLNESTNTEEASIYIEFLTARIDSIDAHITSNKIDTNTLADRNLQMVFPNVAMIIYPQLPLAIANLTDDLYVPYLVWSKDKVAIQRNLKAMLNTLRGLLINDPDWHVIRNQKAFLPFQVDLSDFWGGALGDSAKKVVVPGIFTKEGMSRIDHFIGLVTKAGVIQGGNDPSLQAFWNWYQVEYYEAWRKFVVAFSQVQISSFNDDEKKNLALKMTGESNPYYRFLNFAARELVPNKHLANPPDWANLIMQLDSLQNLSNGESTIVNLQQRVFQGVNKLVNNNTLAQKSELFNQQIKIAGLIGDYNAALSQISPAQISDDSYLLYTGNIFAEYNGKTEPKSPVSIALLKFNQLRQALSIGNSDEISMVWQIEAGPLDFLLQYLMTKTACAIENKWDSEVVGKISTVKSSEIPKILLDKNTGLLWKFVGDTLGPFLTLDQWGYSSRSIYDKTIFAQSVSFNQEFISYINNARPAMIDYQNQYSVNIATVPVTVNPEATTKPYGVILTVQCADGEQTLKNFNYPNQLTVNWSPDKCGDTTLTILFSNLTLNKVYSGGMGFAKFLADFKTGAHEFSNSDFAESDVLEDNYKVNRITVKYKINQNVAAIGLLRNISSNIPQDATNCNNSQKR